MFKQVLTFSAAVLAVSISGLVNAADAVAASAQGATLQRVSFSPPAGDRGKAIGSTLSPLVFVAPPRESAEKGQEIYAPVAKYLSEVLGRKVEYQYPGTWGVYRTEMLRGAYDIVFDGPHFNSYRMERLNHNILVKIPKRHEFVVIVKKDAAYTDIKQLVGRTFCTHAPPNLGTLVLLNEFENPARQPVILNTKGWENIYQGVASGRCVAGILPELNLKKADKDSKARILFRAKVLPNQAFSAGPRLTAEEQAKVAKALTAPAAAEPTAKLRAAYKVGDSFDTANNDEYRGVSVYLKSEWGYF